jgi:hypothetical protein
MITRLKLKPDQRGTKKLQAEHGASLVCVRYRYDEAQRKRLKTVELIVEKADWQPPAKQFADDDLVPMLIGFSDLELREAAKAAKGRWDPEERVWFIRYGSIRGTKLEKHIILDAFSEELISC